MVDILVTIPAHNEVVTIGQVIEGVRRVLPEATIQVVCNACSDNTAILARGHSATVYESAIPGLANAFRMEMEEALFIRAKVIVHIDADGQYEPAEIPLLLEWINKGYDLVLGNRLHRRPEGKKMSRYLLNKVGAMGYSILLQQRIPDMTTGFRAFTPEVAKLPIIANYTYTQEQIWRVIKEGFRIKSVPVAFYPRKVGESRLISNAASYLMRSAKDFRRFAF